MGNQGMNEMSEYQEEDSIVVTPRLTTGRNKNTNINKELAMVNYQKSMLLKDYNSNPSQEKGF